MFKIFARYLSIGVVNNIIHWAIFGVLYAFGSSQSIANFSAFCLAVTFSFFANARWTFKTQATRLRYVLYVVFMGALALGVGRSADHFAINPLVTLVIFSLVSVIVGFLYSRFIVFRIKT
ncbi:translocase [Pantoea rodasii]|uniref:Bactoprenol-linked glucose translocase n=1 Tax=Pantoea rodasii TaxID=1076549 RepID=A0A2M9W9Z4_9GAMM|nr:GtrA family protein [Pantoea rodasii]ORM64645.1 translocase [Pantoea rodasii]PJZ04367.1 translocase [Pantoea rodasii]